VFGEVTRGKRTVRIVFFDRCIKNCYKTTESMPKQRIAAIESQ
jgi:hypothetical protein